MGRLGFLLPLLLLLAPGLAPGADTATFQGLPLNQFQLDNGLRVWHVPRHESPSVAIALVVRAGGRYENGENNGVSHFLEHFLFTETERWSEGEVFQVMNRLGGVNNAITERERTTWYNIAAPEYFEPAMDWMAEVVLHSKLAAEHIDKERQIIFRENGGPDSWFVEWCDRIGYGGPTTEELYARLFPDSTLDLPVIGKNRTLEAMDHATLVNYYHAHYVPNNTLLLVVGNIERPAVEEAARRYFGSWASGPAVPRPATPAMPQSSPIHIIQRGMALQDEGAVWMGARTGGTPDPDQWPLAVLAHVLQERLFQKLRVQEGLVYSVGVSHYTYSDVGDFRVAARAERDHLPRVEGLIRAEEESIKAHGVRADEVSDARKTIIGRHALSMETNYAHAFALIDYAHLPEEAPIPDFDSSILAVTPEDVQRVAKEMLVPARSYVVVYDPICTANELAMISAATTALAIGAYLWRRRKRRRRVLQPPGGRKETA